MSAVFPLLLVAIGVLVVRVGSREVREFHRRTGEGGLLMSVMGLARLRQIAPASGMEAREGRDAQRLDGEAATARPDAQVQPLEPKD